MCLKSVSQILKILYQTGGINVFVFVVSFLLNLFNSKTSFLKKETSVVNFDTRFSRESIGN